MDLTHVDGKYFYKGALWKNVGIFFPDGEGQMGEIMHGRLWPDWGLKS